MVPFSLFLALKYLRPKRTFISVVTVISVVGVLLGVAILVIVLSVMTGFDNMWREKILSFKPHLTVVSQFGVVHDEEALCQELEKVPGVTGAAPVIETLVLIQFEGAAAAPFVIGIDPDRAKRISRVPECTTNGVFELEGNRTVIGIDMASHMGIRVGDTILVHSAQNVTAKDEIVLPEELVVAGIFDMGMRDFDSRFILTSLQTARDLAGMEEGARSIHLMTEDPFDFERMAARVAERLPYSCGVRTWKEVDQLMFKALSHEKTMMFILLLFITIVAIFCVANTLIVITVQKTNEIGLLKALGFSSRKITGAFVWHGSIQCVVGTVLGLGVALLILFNLVRITHILAAINIEVFPKGIYGLDEIPWDFSAGDVTAVCLVVMLACTLASLIPAARAGRLKPAEALRAE